MKNEIQNPIALAGLLILIMLLSGLHRRLKPIPMEKSDEEFLRNFYEFEDRKEYQE